MIRLVCLTGTAVVLIGCAHTDAVDDDGLNARQREARLGAIENWDMRGRLIVDDGERREQLRASWEQRGESLNLIGRGAVGPVGWFRISGSGDRLQIETSRSDPEMLDNPEADLSARLGWWLPVTSLEYWLLGLTDPGFPAEASRGPGGTLARLNQRDWQISYDGYQIAAGLLVPASLTLRHQELELTLNISSWEPAAD